MSWLGRRNFRRVIQGVVLAATVWVAGAAAQTPPTSLTDLLDRLTRRMERYYARARSIICTETVRLQPLDTMLAPDGHARELVYELRVSWDPGADPGSGPEPTVVRELRTVDGRPPRPDFEPGCLDPPAIAADPLALLLSGERDNYQFTWAGSGRERRRAAVMLDFRSRAVGPASVKWKGDCVSIQLPGRMMGRLWVDREDENVLRLDEGLTGRFDLRVPPEKVQAGSGWMEIERADATIRYRRVVFQDPDETLMLPESVVSLTVITGAGVPRLRTTQTYTAYRRFVTDAHMLKESDSR